MKVELGKRRVDRLGFGLTELTPVITLIPENEEDLLVNGRIGHCGSEFAFLFCSSSQVKGSVTIPVWGGTR